MGGGKGRIGAAGIPESSRDDLPASLPFGTSQPPSPFSLGCGGFSIPVNLPFVLSLSISRTPGRIPGKPGTHTREIRAVLIESQEVVP
jgi:hypothetical protein